MSFQIPEDYLIANITPQTVTQPALNKLAHVANRFSFFEKFMQDDLPQMIYQQVLQKLGSQIRPGGEVLLSVDRSKSFVRYRFIFEKQLKGKQINIVFASLPYVKQKDRVWVLDLQNRTMDLSTQTPSMDVKSSFQCNNRLMSSTIGELVQVCEKELVEWPTEKLFSKCRHSP